MGLVIRISFTYKWEMTYFIQDVDEERAKEKAFTMFKDTNSCALPDTLKEACKDNNFCIEVIARVEQIIL